MDNNLEGISVTPDLFPKTSKKVPDVNFYYRCLSLKALFIEWKKNHCFKLLAFCAFWCKVFGDNFILRVGSERGGDTSL